MGKTKVAPCFERALATANDKNDLIGALSELDSFDGQTDGWYIDDTAPTNDLNLCKLAEEFGKNPHTSQRIEHTTNIVGSFNNLISGIRKTKVRQVASEMTSKKRSLKNFLEKSVSWDDEYFNKVIRSQDSLGVITSRRIDSQLWQSHVFSWVEPLPEKPAPKSDLGTKQGLLDLKTLERKLQLLQAKGELEGLKRKQKVGKGMVAWGVFLLFGTIGAGVASAKSAGGATIEEAGVSVLMLIGGAGFGLGGLAISPSNEEIRLATQRVRLLEGTHPTDR